MKPDPAAGTGGGSDAVDMTFWNSVKDSGDPSMFQSYLEQFPNGAFTTLTKVKLGGLKKAQ